MNIKLYENVKKVLGLIADGYEYETQYHYGICYVKVENPDCDPTNGDDEFLVITIGDLEND